VSPPNGSQFKEQVMKHSSDDRIDLGAASIETRGSMGARLELFETRPDTGIAEDD
jgi:hypothetical protein